MLDRDEAIRVVRAAYAARVDGNKAELGRCWAEGARFEIVGDGALLAGVPLTAPDPMVAVASLIDRFAFSELELVDAVVEGNRVVARWSVTVAVAGKPPARTQLMDLIDLDDQGKITSLVQFADTALVRHLAA